MAPGAIARIARLPLLLAALAVAITVPLALGRCANRPVNPPLSPNHAPDEQRFEGMERGQGEHEDLVILAFSGGGQGEHERHASGRVLLWGSGSTAGYRGDHQQRA